MENLKITIDVKRMKGEKDGRKYDFYTYSGYTSKGKKCSFKLTKSVTKKPESEGRFIIEVPKDCINRDKQSRYEEYWIKDITSIEEYQYTPSADEDLPF